jgi:hypothetical protein
MKLKFREEGWQKPEIVQEQEAIGAAITLLALIQGVKIEKQFFFDLVGF